MLEKRKGSFARKGQSIQHHSNPRNSPVKRAIWNDIPLSNFDLLEWIDYLKIPNFKGIYSRDSKDHIHKTGCCIINLDDEIGVGTHWVASFVSDKIIYYFDSFSLPPPIEFVEYAKRLKKRCDYNGGYPIQDIYSVRCGYYCLYFLHNIY